MSLNIKTATGLLEISGKVTKDKIISALEYVPANETHVEDTDVHITSAERETWNAKTDQAALDALKTELSETIVSESDEWVVADEDGNIIAKIGEAGLETTNVIADTITANGVDVGSVLTTHTNDTTLHVTAAERTLWNAKADTTYVDEAIANLVNSAPDALNTLDELAAALGDDKNFATTVTNSLAEKANQTDLENHTNNTTVHITSDERTTWNAKAETSYVDAQINTLSSVVDGKSNEGHTHTASQVGLGNVDNTSDVDKPVSTAQQEALDNLKNELSESITSENREWVVTDEDGNIITRVDENGLETTTVIANAVVVSGTDVETALSGKANSSHTHTVSNITDLTVTATELNYMDGVTSSVQTQLDGLVQEIDTLESNIQADYATKDEIPSTYIKSLSQQMNTLTVTKSDGTTETLTTTYVSSPGSASTGKYFVANDMSVMGDTSGNGQLQYDTTTQTIKNTSKPVNITGNAATATNATNDSNGNKITDTYALKSDIPDYITTGAASGTTIGEGATAEGYQTTASGDYSHAEGYQTTASGMYAHAEGAYTTAAGAHSHAGGYGTIAKVYQCAVGKYNADTTAPTSASDTTTSAGLFIVGIGTGDSSRSNGFRINPAGKVYGTGVFGTSGADYAEYFEWFDGNPNNEDRRGRFVTLVGDKIRYATSNDDYILGVVSANPSVAGDIQSEDWHNRYLKDVFGSKIIEVVEVEETTNENGEVIPAHIERRWVLNPDYDPNVKYTSREERPEWAAIGIVGKLVVVDDGTCQVNGYCYPNVDGIVTASQEKTNYRVMERLDDAHIRIFIR